MADTGGVPKLMSLSSAVSTSRTDGLSWPPSSPSLEHSSLKSHGRLHLYGNGPAPWLFRIPRVQAAAHIPARSALSSESEGSAASLDLDVLQKLCDQGRLEEGLQTVDGFYQQGMQPCPKMYVCLLQGCIRLKRVSDGRDVHLHLVKTGYQCNFFLQKTLVRMYSECGCLSEARELFDKLVKRDVFSWNAIIAGYTNCGHSTEAVTLYRQMLDAGVEPNSFTLMSVLKACASSGSLQDGRSAYCHLRNGPLEADVFVATATLNMFVKCGSMKDARLVFDRMPSRTVVSWNTLLAGYVENGQPEGALELFEVMRSEGIKRDPYTFASALKACVELKALERGRQIHGEVVELGLGSNVYIASTMVDMYGKCGCTEDASKVFDQLQERDVIVWTAMITAYAQNELGVQALLLFWQMQQKGMRPEKMTFVSALKACASLEALDQGRQIHADISRRGYEIDAFLGSSLIEMYARCRCMDEARLIFDRMKERNVVIWNSLISGYVQVKQNNDALELFEAMLKGGTQPDRRTFVSVLKACSYLAVLEKGKLVHAEVVRGGLEQDIFVGSSLVDMYSKCASMEEARKIYDNLCAKDLVSWGALIAGYVKQEQGQEAIALFNRMQEEGIKPDVDLFVCTFKLCGKLETLQQGRQAHTQFLNSGLESSVHVEDALIGMYVQCGSVEEARVLFTKMSHKGLFSFTTLLAGCVEHKHDKEAIHIFEEMLERKLKPDKSCFMMIFNSCGRQRAVDKGKRFYSYSKSIGIEQDTSFSAALMNMFCNCGSIVDAREVFENVAAKDAITWSTIVVGYMKQRDLTEALSLLKRMLRQGVKLDKTTILTIQEACTSSAATELRQRPTATSLTLLLNDMLL